MRIHAKKAPQKSPRKEPLRACPAEATFRGAEGPRKGSAEGEWIFIFASSNENQFLFPKPFSACTGRASRARAKSRAWSRYGACAWLAWGGAGQADPNAVPVTARCMENGNRAEVAGWRSALGTGPGAVAAFLHCTSSQVPTCKPRTRSCCSPPAVRVRDAFAPLGDPQRGSLMRRCAKARARHRRNECCIATQGSAKRRRAVDHEIQAVATSGDAWRSGVREAKFSKLMSLRARGPPPNRRCPQKILGTGLERKQKWLHGYTVTLLSC